MVGATLSFCRQVLKSMCVKQLKVHTLRCLNSLEALDTLPADVFNLAQP